VRIEVLTSLYPDATHPHQGLFAERRWTGMLVRGHEVRVVQPLPRAASWLPLARWRELARVSCRERRSGIEVVRPRYLHLPGRTRGNARAFARAGLACIAGRERPDVVVLDYAWPAAAAASALAARGIPCVVSGRGSDVLAVAEDARLASELARGLRAAGHWCAVSRDLVQALDRLAGVEGRGVLVPNGVDLRLFRPLERGAALQALGRPQSDGEGRLVLVCGHLIERKDPLLALEVFARAAGPRDRLVFLGRGPLRAPLAAAARARALEARVELLGEVPPERLVLWYGAMDALLLTSRREGRPNVVLEALACGRPVLATEAGGTEELLAPFGERMLCRTRDPAALAGALVALLASPPPPALLRAAVAHLSWEASLETLEGLLAAAAGSGASPPAACGGGER
jgi:glycosyltransferase involved in cell wall biosynthesis